MISKYNNFILERALNESTLYVSPEILKRLQKIDSEISKDLIAQLGQDIKPDATFLDESDKEGELTFITIRNAIKKLGDIYHGDPEFVKSIAEPAVDTFAINISTMLKNNEPDFWKQSRNPIKIGRLVRQIFPGKYSDVDIERFVNAFKGLEDKVNEKFILADGKDIKKYYWWENYKEMAGDLGKSCMARKKKYFKIYTKNPEVCRLLVLLEDDKVIGRALIWKLDRNDGPNEIEYFMDRQYTILQSDVLKFTNYAKENGWAYKTYNNHHSYSNITFNGEEKNCDIVVKVKVEDYDQYPYMDTLKRFNPKTGELFNDTEKDGNKGQYLLEDTDGDYTEITGGKWSEYYGEEIPEQDAVWSDAYQNWLYDDRSVHIEPRSGREHTGWFPEDDDNIYYSEWEDEYLHIDDCVYSDDKDEYILKRNAVLGVYEIEPDGSSIETSYYHKDDDYIKMINRDATWYTVVNGKNEDWEEVGAMKWDLLTDKNYPKVFNVFVYKSKADIYLSPRDAKILGMEYDKEGKDEISDFEYHKRLDEMNLLSGLIEKLKNDLIPNTERIADEGEDDMKQMYEDRLARIWDRMSEVWIHRKKMFNPEWFEE
jgi:predicted nucleotidyltransferase